MKQSQQRPKIWIVRVMESDLWGSLPPVVRSAAVTGLPAIAFFVAPVISRWSVVSELPTKTVISLLLAFVWVFLGPYFILVADRATDRFWAALARLPAGISREQANEAAVRFDRFYIRATWISTTIWCSICMVAISLNVEYFELLGFTGWSDPFFWLLLVFALFVFNLMVFGFGGVLQMIYIIFWVVRNNFIDFDLFNDDEVGGFSCVGDFSFRITLLFSSGVLFIPIVLDLSSSSGFLVQLLLSIAVVLFSSFIVLSFVLPTAAAFKIADDRKSALMGELQDQYSDYLDHVRTSREPLAVTRELRAKNTHDLIKIIQDTSTYPFRLNIIVKLIGAGLLPILIFLVDALTNTDSILYNLDRLSGF